MLQSVKLGFCPIGKFVFSHEDAKVYKKLLEQKMDAMGIHYIGIDSVIADGIIRSYDHVDTAVNFLKSQNIDALFIPHCNFGTESAAGLIAKKLGVPVLLWGPRDEAPLPDGSRYRDTLCGMLASSKVLRKLGVPFTYIENCRIDEEPITKGLESFLRTANVVKRVKGARIGIIGNRIDFFWSTIIDENDLLQRFGIEILPLDIGKAIVLTKERARIDHEKYCSEIEMLKNKIDISLVPTEGMINVLALRDVIYHFAKSNHLAAVALESFMTLNDELGACVSFAMAAVTDMGIPCVCESDIHGAVSSVMAEAAALNDSPSFFADVTIRHPDNDNGLLLWHDSFPLSLKKEGCKGSLGTHWILKDIGLGMCHWEIKPGEVTILRFDGEHGSYKLLAQKARGIEGPFTQNTYLWVEVDDWKGFERRMIEGPYIHHTSCIYGDYVDVLQEACKYLGIGFDGSKK